MQRKNKYNRQPPPPHTFASFPSLLLLLRNKRQREQHGAFQRKDCWESVRNACVNTW